MKVLACSASAISDFDEEIRYGVRLPDAIELTRIIARKNPTLLHWCENHTSELDIVVEWKNDALADIWIILNEADSVKFRLSR